MKTISNDKNCETDYLPLLLTWCKHTYSLGTQYVVHIITLYWCIYLLRGPFEGAWKYIFIHNYNERYSRLVSGFKSNFHVGIYLHEQFSFRLFHCVIIHFVFVWNYLSTYFALRMQGQHKTSLSTWHEYLFYFILY